MMHAGMLLSSVAKRGPARRWLGPIVLALALAIPATAGAASPGALTQLTGADGCLSVMTNTFDPPCGVGSTVYESTSVALSPDDLNVYSVATDSEGMEVLSRDPNTGVLTQLPGTAGCITATGVDDNGTADACSTANGLGDGGGKGGNGPTYVTVSPDGKNVYVTNGNLSTITVFTRDAANNGALTPVQCLGEIGNAPTGCSETSRMLSDLHAIVVSPDGTHVYAVAGDAGTDGAVLMFNRSATDGTIVPPSDATNCVTISGLDSNNDPCGTARALREPYHLAFSPDGKQLYIASSEGDTGNLYNGDGAVVTLNVQSDGSLVQPDGPAGCLHGDGTGDETDPTACAQGKPMHDLNGVAVSPDGKNVYAASAGEPGAVEVLQRATTGALTQDVASSASCFSIDGTDGYHGTADTCTPARAIGETYRVTVSPDGGFLYVASQGVQMFSIAGIPPSVNVPGSIAVFARDSSGALTQLTDAEGCTSNSTGDDGQGGTTCTPGRALEGAYQLVVTADCVSAYVASQDAPGLAMFSRRPCLPPLADTTPATDVTTESATLHGTANPRGTSASAFFQWGTSTAYGNTTPSQDMGEGTSAAALSAGLTGLSPGTTYHFRTVATNVYGTAYGPDQQFTTALPPVVPASSPPAVIDKAGPTILVLGARTFGGACSKTTVLRLRISLKDPSGIGRVDVFVDRKRVKRIKGRHLVIVKVSARSLSAGPHTIRVIAQDSHGNKTTKTVHIRRCPRPPTQLVAPQFTG